MFVIAVCFLFLLEVFRNSAKILLRGLAVTKLKQGCYVR